MYKQISTLNSTLFPTVFYVPVRLLCCSFIGSFCAYISVSISMHKVAAGLFRGSTAFNHDTVLPICSITYVNRPPLAQSLPVCEWAFCDPYCTRWLPSLGAKNNALLSLRTRPKSLYGHFVRMGRQYTFCKYRQHWHLHANGTKTY